MDARTLANALDASARELSAVACDLSEAGFGLGRAVAQTVWEGRAADAACAVIADAVGALAECAFAADRAARSASRGAIDAWVVAAIVEHLP